MEHDKIIKKKLEERTVLPKENTWNRLEMLLDEEDKKANKKGYFKYFVAASVILFLGVFFLKTETSPIVIPQVVVEVPVEKKDNTIVQENAIIPIVVNEQILKANKNTQVVSSKTIKLKSVKQKINRVVGIDEANSSLLNSKEEVAIQVTGLEVKKINNQILLDTEVDDLLAIALAENVMKTKQQIKIDENLNANANALLSNIEQELDLSFKERMFGKLKKGLQNTRTAVINRNK